MAREAYYDVVVVGKDLGSILCAALLSHAGKRVLLAENSSPLWKDRKQELQGFLCGSDSFLGLGGGLTLEQSLRDLGIYREDDFIQLQEVAHLIAPEFRVRLDRDFSVTLGELRREFEKGISTQVEAKLKHLYAAALSNRSALEATLGLEEQRSLTKIRGGIRGLARSRGRKAKGLTTGQEGDANKIFKKIVVPMVAMGSFVAPENLNLGWAVQFLGLALTGQSVCRRGLEYLREELRELIRNTGGVIKGATRVKSLVVKDRQITGALLSSFDGVVYADNIVLGSDHRKIYETLTLAIRDQGIMKDLGRIDVSHWRFSMLLHVNACALPDLLVGAASFVGDFTLPLEEENLLMLRVLRNTEIGQGETPGKKWIAVSVLVPNKASYKTGEHIRKLCGKVLHRLENIIPFLAENLNEVRPDFRNGVLEIEKAYPVLTDQSFLEEFEQYYVRGQKEEQAFSALGWVTPHENLFFCGRVIWPSLGRYGEALVARKVFEALLIQGPNRERIGHD